MTRRPGISAPRAERSAQAGAGPVRPRASHPLPPAPPPIVRPLRPGRDEPLFGQKAQILVTECEHDMSWGAWRFELLPLSLALWEE